MCCVAFAAICLKSNMSDCLAVGEFISPVESVYFVSWEVAFMIKQPDKPITSMEDDDLVSSFLAVRRAIGLAGISLPVLLFASAWALPDGEMKPSISEFYHTFMGDLLVGVLVAIGLFLIAYVGHKPKEGEFLTDWWVSTLAGIGAVGVALYPTTPDDLKCEVYEAPETVQGIVSHWCQWWEPIHFISAGLFFVCMALFCFFLFPKVKGGGVSWSNEPGNVTYFTCGIALVVSIVGLLAYFIVKTSIIGEVLAENNFVFWFETLGVVAFAIAWLTKGNLLGGMSNIVTLKPKHGAGQKR